MENEGSLPYSQVPASCPYPEPDHSSPCHPPSTPPRPTSWRSILKLSSHLRQGLPSDLFPSGFLCIRFSPTRAAHSAHLILLDFITRTTLGEEYSSLSSSLCSFLHYTITSSLLVPNILLSTLFTNTCKPTPSLSVRDQFLHPLKTTGKVAVLYILIFICLDSKVDDVTQNQLAVKCAGTSLLQSDVKA